MPAVDTFLSELRAVDPSLAGAIGRGRELSASQRSELREQLRRYPQLERQLAIRAFACAFIGARKSEPDALELPELDRRMQGIFVLIFPNDGSDLEYALARDVLSLLELERAFASSPEARARWQKMSAALMTVPEVYGAMLAGSELDGLRGLLELIARWISARALYTQTFGAWTSTAQADATTDRLAQLTFASAAS